MAELSKAEKLLVAACLLSSEGHTVFSAENLIVRAFQAFPRDFSLKGYPEYPDSNVVLTQVMGKKAPLIVRGWLEKTGVKQYRLTPKGLDDRNLLEHDQGGISNVRLERLLEEGLARLLKSASFELFKSGQKEQITFNQFCRFAGLSARDKWQKIQNKLASVRHAVEEARKLGESGQGAIIWVGGHNDKVSGDDLRLLDPLLTFLLQRFKLEMDEWKRNALR
ncbi:MAG: hypothetical protein A2162_04070 [Deltaproteobacteria bacterium RBG_13_52_11b]|nr:MAG: hypothetical protein A2162_04070 [Deltaproteobacteria bacterium RBG_13_52_11b]